MEETMITSLDRYDVSEDEEFRGRVLIVAVTHAQEIMNIRGKEDDIDLLKLKAKATELLNSPDSFKERLALSVVSLLPEEVFHEGLITTTVGALEDIDLELAIPDAFDALAGVTSGTTA